VRAGWANGPRGGRPPNPYGSVWSTLLCSSSVSLLLLCELLLRRLCCGPSGQGEYRMTEYDELLARLSALEAADTGPFPYDGCRRLRPDRSPETHGLEPDLDVYLGDLAGYRSWGKRILKWPDAKIKSVEEQLSRSFFDCFPQYRVLTERLAAGVAPDVSQALANADETREVLLQLLSAIRRIRNADGHDS